MTRMPLKWMLVGLVVVGTGLTGVALLRGAGHAGTPTGDSAVQLKEVQQDLTRMHKAFQGVRAMLATAKKQKDIIRINCIQRKLEQMRNLIMLAREQYSKYLMDKASGTTGSSVSLRQRISMFKERVHEKVQEARQCAGEAIKITDKPDIDVIIDPNIPQEDPTNPWGSTWVMPRPPEASPFM